MNEKVTTKKSKVVFGRSVNLLGKDDFGTKYWLVENSDVVETYDNNKQPENSTKTMLSTTFKDLFIEKKTPSYNEYKSLLTTTTLSNVKVNRLLKCFNMYYSTTDNTCRTLMLVEIDKLLHE